jgi:hypothetical protein
VRRGPTHDETIVRLLLAARAHRGVEYVVYP